MGGRWCCGNTIFAQELDAGANFGNGNKVSAFVAKKGWIAALAA